ncbi:MAG: hypothetical protein JJ863_19005 [Deltaproteobacteria bacterium]|nr:hypothetical protein [Deltaproteobacteria bacterium]
MTRALTALVMLAATSTAEADERFEVGGAQIHLVFEGGDEGFRELAREWVRSAAGAVADYYDGFPVPEVRVEVVARMGSGVGFGQAFAGRRLRVRVGRRSERSDFEEDWVLVHEMLHLGYPMLDRRHRWMREGLSTYVEPIVRARAGLATERGVWRRLTSRMHHGLPRPGDEGLDRTPTWGRTYWGGALYWLLADVRIRRETDGRRSLRDALTAIARAGGTARVRWPIERGLAIGDRATGTDVLVSLYRAMARAPYPVDLDELFERLGVTDPAHLNDDAPLAGLRRAITRRRESD